MITFTGHPSERNRDYGVLGGAYINAWIDAKSENEALTRGEQLIEEREWIMDSIASVGHLGRSDYDDDDEGLQYFDQALTDGEVLVFHTWPHERQLLSSQEVAVLLDRLCLTLGLCLHPEACRNLKEKPPMDIDGFTNAVLLAEGIDPVSCDRKLYRQARAIVAHAFAENEDAVH